MSPTALTVTAIGKELLRIAAGAGLAPLHFHFLKDHFNIRFPDPELQKLEMIDGGKVSKKMTVSGPHKGIAARAALPQSIGGFRTDLETAGPDTGADAGQYGFRFCARSQHASYGMHDDTTGRSAPSGMHGSDHAACRIGQQNRRAIGYANGKRTGITAEQNICLLAVYAAVSTARQGAAAMHLNCPVRHKPDAALANEDLQIALNMVC